MGFYGFNPAPWRELEVDNIDVKSIVPGLTMSSATWTQSIGATGYSHVSACLRWFIHN